MYMYNNGYPYYYVYVPVNYYHPYQYPLYAQQIPQQSSRPGVQQLIQRIRTEHSNLYTQLEQAGVNPQMVDTLIFLTISYLQSQQNLNRTPTQIYNQFQRDNPWFLPFIRSMNFPENTVNRILIRVIELALSYIRGESPTPEPGPRPEAGWSDWESLGGTLLSAPSVSSWAPNRLDVFARGSDNTLYHIWWDGNRWSNWESLGGVLTSAPGSVSWGPNRTDVFARGQNNDLIHRYQQS